MMSAVSFIAALLKQASTLDDLHRAKAHSDNQEYRPKADILKRLMRASPDDWKVDQPDRKFPGVTHIPSGYRFHLPAYDVSLRKQADMKPVYVGAGVGAGLGAAYGAYSGEGWAEKLRNSLAYGAAGGAGGAGLGYGYQVAGEVRSKVRRWLDSLKPLSQKYPDLPTRPDEDGVQRYVPYAPNDPRATAVVDEFGIRRFPVAGVLPAMRDAADHNRLKSVEDLYRSLHAGGPGSLRGDFLESAEQQGHKPAAMATTSAQAKRLYDSRGLEPVPVIEDSGVGGSSAFMPSVTDSLDIDPISGSWRLPGQMIERGSATIDKLSNPFSNLYATRNHEAHEHGRQLTGYPNDKMLYRYPDGSRMHMNAEIPAGLGDLVFGTERFKAEVGAPIQHTVTFPNGTAHDAQWMADRAREHGYWNGNESKSMTELLSSTMGQQWLKHKLSVK